MAMFKVFYGPESYLSKELNPGTLYFTTDTNKMFIDFEEKRLLMAIGEQVPPYSEEILNSNNISEEIKEC